MKHVKGVVVSMALLATVACGGPESAAPPATAPATAPAVSMAPMSTVAPVGATAGGFGVAECDSYMRKYKACLDSKVPVDMRPVMQQSLDQTAAAWRQASATPEGRTSLASACLQMETQAKQSMSAYGCTW